MQMPYEVNIVIYGGILLFMTLSGVIVFFVQAYRKRQTEHSAEKNLMLERFKSTLTSAQLEISEKTMKDISLEIHDNIGQRLTLAIMHLRSKQTDLHTVVEIIELALSDMRRLSKSLNSNFIVENGIDMALEREVRLINSAGQINCKYHTSTDPLGLVKEQEVILFRCIQELISNAIKHSSGTEIIVELAKEINRVSASVLDNGTGLRENTSDGLGLQNIRERVDALKGTFEISSRSPKGMLGKIEIPLQRNDFT